MTPDLLKSQEYRVPQYVPLPLDEIAQSPLGGQLDLEYLAGRLRPPGVFDHPLGAYLISRFGRSHKNRLAFSTSEIAKMNKGGIVTFNDLLNNSEGDLRSLGLNPDNILESVGNILKYVVGPGPEGLFTTSLVVSVKDVKGGHSVALNPADERERNIIVEELIEKLTPEQRRLVRHRFGFIGGVPRRWKETAAEIGRNPNTTTVIFTNICTRLKFDVPRIEPFFAVE